MFAIVWLFPVPGGPWITMFLSARAALTAALWDVSASSTKNSRGGERMPSAVPADPPPCARIASSACHGRSKII